MSPAGATANDESSRDVSDSHGEPVSEAAHFAPPGTLCTVRNLYRTKPDEDGRTSWTTEMPDDVTEPPENQESAQYAIIVRKEKCYDGRKSLKVHSVIVQSALLKKFLDVVLKDYPGITTNLDRVEFGSPFEPFVHKWAEFVDAKDREQDEETKKHVDLLFHVLEEELRHTIQQVEDLVANGVITYDLLWTIFEPGSIIFGLDIGGGGAHISSGGAGRTNGIMTRERLMARGRLWEKHKGYHYKHYEGIAAGTLMGKPAKFNIHGRIIIDTEAFNTFNPNESVSVSSGIATALDDGQCLLATPMLRGYSLKEKRWLEFRLDFVREIVWNEQAFDVLVLPPGQQGLKQLILALVRSQARHKDSFDDVIQGKGRGVIMLLSGPPGVGKTLTAESVAETMKVPLYMMSAGDLGTNAEKVETALKDILRMVPKWGAVLLLDEADVFLEARSSSDLARNELVSIFLRMFEYYEGVLFLTTNRVEQIDPAFESRIHVSLQYPELDVISRRHVWLTFLRRVANVEAFSDEAFDKLSEARLNGRQIKNVVKIAHLLATEQGTELHFTHVDTVLKLKAANPGTQLEWRGATEDFHGVVGSPDAPVPTAPADHPDRTSRPKSLDSPLSMRVERTGTIEYLNQAIEAAGKAMEATPQGHPDRVARLDNLGIWLGRRFERTGSMDDLNRAVDVANMAVDATPQDHPDRAGRLSNLGTWLGRRFERTGSMDDLNRAVDIMDMAVHATPQDHPHRAPMLNNLGNLLGSRFGRTGSMDDLNRAVDIADMATPHLKTTPIELVG
ncbi:hypothetical protein DL770_010908 [Monosporascus sp. CRB-9-2]|nr:hypothetical protein DL770_010908 [Monosporascus sp. CRB-9-2]